MLKELEAERRRDRGYMGDGGGSDSDDDGSAPRAVLNERLKSEGHWTAVDSVFSNDGNFENKIDGGDAEDNARSEASTSGGDDDGRGREAEMEAMEREVDLDAIPDLDEMADADYEAEFGGAGTESWAAAGPGVRERRESRGPTGGGGGGASGSATDGSSGGSGRFDGDGRYAGDGGAERPEQHDASLHSSSPSGEGDPPRRHEDAGFREDNGPRRNDAEDGRDQNRDRDDQDRDRGHQDRDVREDGDRERHDSGGARGDEAGEGGGANGGASDDGKEVGEGDIRRHLPADEDNYCRADSITEQEDVGRGRDDQHGDQGDSGDRGDQGNHGAAPRDDEGSSRSPSTHANANVPDYNRFCATSIPEDMAVRRAWLMQPLWPGAASNNVMIRCFVERRRVSKRSNTTYVFHVELPRSEEEMKEGGRSRSAPVMYASKIKRAVNPNYVIALNERTLSLPREKRGDDFLGKVKGNFKQTEYMVYDDGVNLLQGGQPGNAARGRREFAAVVFNRGTDTEAAHRIEAVVPGLGSGGYQADDDDDDGDGVGRGGGDGGGAARNDGGGGGDGKEGDDESMLHGVWQPPVERPTSSVVWRPETIEDSMLSWFKRIRFKGAQNILCRERIVCMNNRTWSSGRTSNLVDYGGRATTASCKNFQLCLSTPEDKFLLSNFRKQRRWASVDLNDSRNVLLQMGRDDHNDRFNIDFQVRKAMGTSGAV